MDIDNLKTKWKNMPSHKPEDSSLNETTLKDIMGKRYNSLFIKIAIPELLVAVGYLFLIVFLVVFFHFFQETWLQVLAILAMVLLITIPTLSLVAFFRYYQSRKPSMPVVDALATIQKNGQLFMKTQYLLLALNLLLVIDLIILVPLVYSEHLSLKQMVVSIVVGVIVIFILSIMIWRYHKKKINGINEFARNIS